MSCSPSFRVVVVVVVVLVLFCAGLSGNEECDVGLRKLHFF